MKKIILMVALMILSYVKAYAYDYDCGIDGTSGTIPCAALTCSYQDPCTGVTSWVIYGVYETYEAANSAATTRKPELMAEHPTYTGAIGPTNYDSYTGVTGSSVDYAIWNAVRINVYRCATSGSFWYVEIFLYPDPTWIDENDDCINDNQPEQNDCPNLWMTGSITNTDGTCYYYAKFIGSDGNSYEYGDPMAFGDLMNGDIDGTINYYQTEPPKYSDGGEYIWPPITRCNVSQYLDACEGGSLPENQDTDNDPTDSTKIPDYEDGDTGQEAETGDTDNELLGKIADNTAEIANNTDVLPEGLEGIQKELIKSNQTLSEILDKTGVNGWSALKDALNESLDSETSDLVDANTALYNAYELDDVDELISSIEADEDMTVIDGIIEDIQDMPVFTDSGFTITDSECAIEFDLDILGTEKHFDLNFCEYEWFIDMLGTLLLGLAGLKSLFYIFG